MTHFNGFDDWIEIFRGGPQTDSNGVTHDGDRLIEQAVRSFDISQHEPPLVIGHPTDNAPAFGWVAALKTAVQDGVRSLLAKFGQVVPEVETAAKQGLYKKRSASFYPDGRLRHVGLLGAAPPAVKGLADLKFEADEESYIFQEDLARTGGGGDPAITDADRAKTQKEDVMEFSIKDMLELIKFGRASREPDQPDQTDPDGNSFTETDLEAAKKEAAEDAAQAEREKVEAEFAEKARKQARAQRRAEISDWYDQNLEAGKVIPAWDKLGLEAFMQSLDAEEEISFSEDSKTNRLEWFKSFLAAVGQVVDFKEVASRDQDVLGGNPQAKLIQLAEAKAKDGVDFQTAMMEAGREHPELVSDIMAIEK